jgi:TetR/AcrR family transcriptional repressor of nem operon
MTQAVRTHPQAGTAERILDVAERLVQVRGYNGFSYADVAAEVKIATASLHYHFASKAELGVALITRYAARFDEALAEIDRALDGAPAKLDAYVAIYASVLRRKRMCLCGILAAEYQTLPQPMRRAVTRFFDANEVWLTGVLEAGRAEGSLTFAGPARDVADMLVSGLEGAMLVARPRGDIARFRAVAGCLLAGLGGA